MATDFSRTLSLLRQEKGVSQRKAAAELGISQALLSHYENGIREPGLAFVVRACDYYQVSADYLLGRLTDRGTGQGASQGPDPEPGRVHHRGRGRVRLLRRKGQPAGQHHGHPAKKAGGEHRRGPV